MDKTRANMIIPARTKATPRSSMEGTVRVSLTSKIELLFRLEFGDVSQSLIEFNMFGSASARAGVQL